MKISLKNQIWLLFIATSFLVLGLVLYSIFFFYHKEWINHEIEELTTEFQEMGEKDFDTLSQEIEDAEYYIAVPHKKIFSPLAQTLLPKSIQYPFDTIDTKIFLFQKFSSEKWGEFILGEDVSKYYQSEEKILLILLKISFVLFFAVILVGFLFSRLAVKPIQRFRDEIATIEADSLSQYQSSLQFSIHDELGQLQKSFQVMLEKIHKHQKHEKEFIALASHELKTPLTALISSLEIAKRYPEKITEALEEALSLSHLLQQLLFLSKIENASFPCHSIDISQLVKRELEKYQKLAQAKKIKCNTQISDTVVIKTNQELFTRILQNLLENALKFTPNSQEINIVLHHSFLSIQNSCNEYIDTEKVTKAFYQGDVSKSQEGAGLGLYFVQKCVSILKMDLHISYENGIFEVKISW